MKKLLIGAAVLALIALPGAAHAQAVAPVVPVPACNAAALPVCPVGSVWLPAVAVGLAAFVIYADATGIPFPLCNRFGLKCFYDDYPDEK